jgi:hypothetical protein
VTFRLDVQRGLSQMVGAARQLEHDAQWRPAPTSPAATTSALDERWTGPWGRRPLRDAYLSAALPLASAEDHLLLLAHAIGSGPVHFAYSTVARGAMEAAGRAWWLLDPDVEDSKRLGRYMTDRLYSFHETLVLAAAEGELDGSSDLLTQQHEKIRRIERAATDHGFHLHRNKQQLAVAVGEPRPPSTRLMKLILQEAADLYSPGAMIYRVLSATAHATLYALMQSATVIDGLPDGSSLARVSMDDIQLARATIGPVLAYSRSFTAMLNQWGWLDRADPWSEAASRLAHVLADRITQG